MNRGWKHILQPRTLGGTLALFTVGYVLWQPTAQLLLHWVLRDPLPFATGREWAEFIAVCAALGILAGALYFAGERRPAGSYSRAWLRSWAWAIALTTMTQAKDFSRQEITLWLVVLLFASLVVSGLYMPLQRWSDASEARREAERARARDAEPSSAD